MTALDVFLRRVPCRVYPLDAIDKLLGAYTSLAVVEAAPVEIDVRDVTDGVPSRVRWELKRGDGRAVYDFTAIYTLVDNGGGFRVAAIAHTSFGSCARRWPADDRSRRAG